jgi:hypothetical protein
LDYLNEAKDIWRRISKSRLPKEQLIKPEDCARLLGAFQMGDFFYNLFNISESRIEFTSDGVRSLLGIAPEELTIDLFFDRIHPKDLPRVVEYEKLTADFLTVLPSSKILRYH